MNKDIVKMELKRTLIGLLIWTIAIGISLFLIVILYPIVKDMFDQMPESLREMMESFGGIPENIIEYFATEGGTTLQIFGAIFSAIVGFNAIAREEREKNTDTIYVLPVSREHFYLNKLIAVVTQILIFSIGVGLFTFIGFIIGGTLEGIGSFFIFMLLTTITFIMVGCFGFALGCITKGGNQMIALIIPVPLYIISLLSTISDNKILKNIKYLSPFTFSDPVSIFKTDYRFEYVNFIVFLIITGLIIWGSFKYYKNKEFNQ